MELRGEEEPSVSVSVSVRVNKFSHSSLALLLSNRRNPIVVNGRIEYMKALGGHFVMSQNPAEEFIILNPNPKVSEDLYKSGKTISIEEHLTIGADHVFRSFNRSRWSSI